MSAVGTNSTVLITGASSGIGKELANLFAADGHDLIVAARRKEKLEELKQELEDVHGVRVSVMEKDLSVQDAGTELYSQIEKKGIEVDILVNNAGFGGQGRFIERDWEADLAMINVNITSLTELTRRFLPGMVKRGRGKVLNIASTAAFLPGPLQAVYYATKAFVISFSQAIAEEVAGTGVTVTAVCPSATATEFQDRAGLENTEAFSDQSKMDTAADVAATAYKALQRGKRVEITRKGHAFMLRFLIPFMPRKSVARVSKKMNETG